MFGAPFHLSLRSVDGKKGGGPELLKFMEEATNSFELAP